MAQDAEYAGVLAATFSRLGQDESALAGNISTDPPLPSVGCSSAYAKLPEGLSNIEDFVKWWKEINPRDPNSPATTNMPVGGITGWDSTCPPPTRITRDWLDFLYWDTGVAPVVGHRVAARISFSYPDMNDGKAVMHDQQKSLIIASGDAVDIRYPVYRDEHDGPYVVRRVKMPKPDKIWVSYDELIKF
ncbi:hypothetical protein DL96DRAFT_1821309 [Flagelloscypha sp. PMI_526]|nr:hypothetical protein DL96DRAFT_1821309 [Flagelloscypha sp. PMI_526]